MKWSDFILQKKMKIEMKRFILRKNIKIERIYSPEKRSKNWNENFFLRKKMKVEMERFFSQENDDGNYQI